MRLRAVLCVLMGVAVLGVPAGASGAGACPNEAVRDQQGSTFLGECRAWEMVSPVDKNGGDVVSSWMPTHSSVDGNALIFASQTAFGDAQGTNVTVEYAAQRAADGWATHAITPPQEPYGYPLPSLSSTRLLDDVSGDLSTGVMYAVRPLTDAPNVAHVPNLYLRRDLLSGPPGSYQLLTDSVQPLEPFFTPFVNAITWLAGASEDFHHIIFETRSDLTSDASGEEWKLYEWNDGVVRLAGILPDGTPALNSEAGRGANDHEPLGSNGAEHPQHTPHMISRDGSRVFFTVSTESEQIRSGVSGKIFVREDHATTTQLNVSERSTADPNGPQPAELWDVTPDGSRVFFTTSEELTDNDSNNEVDLYRYDFSEPVGHRLTLISHDEEGNAAGRAGGEYGTLDVLGISDDGSYVYFHDEARLTPDAPNLVNMDYVYVWHDGVVHLAVAEHAAQDNRALHFGGPIFDIGYRFGSGFRVSPNGHLAYTTSTLLREGGLPCESTGNCEEDEVYLYDPVNDRLVCASCAPSGENPTQDASFTRVGDIGRFNQARGVGQHLARALTADGEMVFFDSPDALVPQDTNGAYDVYSYDLATGGVSLISSGQSPAQSLFVEASPDGRDVFFTTRQRLVSQDIDGNSDVYDARVGGGIAAQNAVPAAGCVGEGCQGGSVSGPGVTSVASSVLSGAGNLPAVVGAPVVKAKKKPVKHKAKKQRKKRRKKRARRSSRGVSHRSGR